MIDVFDASPVDGEKSTESFDLDPESFGEDDFAPIATPEIQAQITELYATRPELGGSVATGTYGGSVFFQGSGITNGFDREDAWIQTHSGRRFNPLNPYVDAIVIQDIAHALSMQCRFSGHTKKFYSVAQHSVLVSYICDSQDALWGLMHDASEAYLVDVPRPLKQSGQFDAYIEFEARMMKAICKRFGLVEKEPPSVKRADTILLSTEARDLMSPLHPDWTNRVDPLPFTIEAWGPDKAKDMFMKRFFELTGHQHGYEHYLKYRDQL